MLIEGTLNSYLADINQQAEQMFHYLLFLVQQRNEDPRQNIQGLENFYIKMVICELRRRCICG
ncbi:MAG: hypothetical protein IJZ34_07320 [Lachnospiraceae bacterium]|nr:hypothetical protein [Lachnospiraceae bacterium]